MTDHNTGDLKPSSLPRVNWSAEDRSSGLDSLSEAALNRAYQAIDWYYQEKEKKRQRGKSIRLVALLFALLAGVLPSVAQMTMTSRLVVPPAMATVALTIAAFLVALDHFYGFTSAWMRYISTAMDLRQLTDEFQLDWEAERFCWSGGPPSDEQVARSLKIIRALITDINQTIRRETNSWIGEFHTSLLAIEELTKIRVDAASRSTLKSTVAISTPVPSTTE